MFENISKGSTNRRTLVKGAAWSVPVVALAVAAPSAAASGEVETPVFYDWSVGGSASVGSGNNAFFTVNGQSADGEDATVPAGFTIVITPPEGVTLKVNSYPGFINVQTHADGRITADVIADFPGKPRINFMVTGPVGAVITSVGYGPFAPFEDAKVLTIREG
ncbi:hypothetical protein CQ018_17305 [Arthrobacter sp. MYb227]|uniref:hypothetical protein n=1 Tax=Arthrobacter sp. MYb227 TaxID=1848601 RepID=UPI000CFC4EAB|nr:hypothetical protein [Arthrobacter sp. MYb227]PQZ87708.1 hypothetical protein CQ018_17305 [Arthrobacter sp. MYb227]